MSHPVKSPRKLIEVALPLDAINAACSREKSIRHGHPSALHLWWARRPLAAARAVIFAQLVNDPGYQQGGGFKYGKNKKDAAIERKRLFKIIEDLVLWESTNNDEVLERARAEIRRSWRELCELNKDHPQATELFNPDKLPALHDPFAGGGAIPLEAQRLGLEVYASDLNPVAVFINKAMIEIPPKFAGRPPVSLAQMCNSAEAELDFTQSWPGATGLAEDVRYYGEWMRGEAQKRIGHLYPPVEITPGMAKERPDLRPFVGQKLTVIAWLWARTVKSPNPAFSQVDVPLVSTFVLSRKPGKESYVQPVIDGDRYSFRVKVGKPSVAAENGTSLGPKGGFRCLMSDVPIDYSHIRNEARAGRLGAKLMAIVAGGERGRLYFSPLPEHEAVKYLRPEWIPSTEIVSGMSERVVGYGLHTYADLFTPRQLTALLTLGDLVREARQKIKLDALKFGVLADSLGLEAGGLQADAYAEGVSVYLACMLDKFAESHSSLCTWSNSPKNELVVSTFRRQALPITWDFAEANPFAESSGSFTKIIDAECKVIQTALPANSRAYCFQADAQSQEISRFRIVSTDPPYYDNIGYADLSDYFYVWLRRAMRDVFPSLFATLSVPKTEELVAASHRHGGSHSAELFFLDGMTKAMHNIAAFSHPAYPVTIYYAFKQSETDSDSGTSSTGWQTFLESLLKSGMALTGTWPMRTERSGRTVSLGKNSLASSVILVCRQRAADAPTVSRREFLRELNAVLPEALDEMTKGSGDDRSPVAPVDLSQAIIGPGMAVFSKYTAVLEADGSPMSVRTALQLINRFLAEDDFDADTQFCLHWFEQHGWIESAFGEADVLARSKSTSVDAMKEAGVLQSGGGKVRLLKWTEYPTDWDPRTDARTPIWEALHQLIRALKQGGESASGALLALLGGKAEAVRQLAYRLYTLCERLGQAENARAYNELITSWTGIESAAASVPKSAEAQGVLFES
jgi:putative DNA methylase